LKSFFKFLIKVIDKINEFFGFISNWLTTVLVILVCYDVFNRYLFGHTNPAMYELEWHIYAIIFLFGAGYALKYDKHVRVDITYVRFSPKVKAWVNLLGAIIFLLPFCVMVVYATKDWVWQSWIIKETSPDPGGLPARYILKACIPLCFILLFIQGISEMLKAGFFIFGSKDDIQELQLEEKYKH
jgi:TRAP-type mannitol/chloroaromatic compound transport system permease small subunit